MSRRARWIVGLLILLLAGWAVTATASLVFFPIDDEGQPPPPVTVETTITVDQP